MERRPESTKTKANVAPKQTARVISKLHQYETILTFERNFMVAAQEVLDNTTFAKIIGVAVNNARHSAPAD